MKVIKAVSLIIVLAGLFSVLMYNTKNNHMASVAAVESATPDEAEPDRALCDQLLRFGQVALDRGQFAEAKHFFQKAITVDPGHAPAWKKYNMALLAQITAKVETDPVFLPDFAADTGVTSQSPQSTQFNPETADAEDDDDGC